MTWPKDADGDVFRSLQKSGFDLEQKKYPIDFNVDFKQWPPSNQAMEALRSRYSAVKLYPPEGEGIGYALVTIEHTLNYEFVVATLKELDLFMRPYGGVCDSWGVAGP